MKQVIITLICVYLTIGNILIIHNARELGEIVAKKLPKGKKGYLLLPVYSIAINGLLMIVYPILYFHKYVLHRS